MKMALIYVVLGFVGAYFHWLKVRYKDKRTTCTLEDYLMQELPATLYAVGAIMFTEVSLAAAAGDVFTLNGFVAAVGTGFGFDSGLNMVPPNDK